MPTPGSGPRLTAVQRLRIARAERLLQRLVSGPRHGRNRPGGGAGEALPVEPNRPLDLSGGAAAALDFEN